MSDKNVERAAKLDLWFANNAIKKLMTQMHKLPSPPAIYFQIVRELHSPKASLDNVGAIIAQDLAVTAKLLQLVNSASFGMQRKVANPAVYMVVGHDSRVLLWLLPDDRQRKVPEHPVVADLASPAPVVADQLLRRRCGVEEIEVSVPAPLCRTSCTLSDSRTAATTYVSGLS